MAEPNLVDVRLDGLPYKASPEVSKHLEKLAADLAASNKRADTAEAERDTLKSAATKHAEELDKVRADSLVHAQNRMVLVNAAREHGVEIKADQTDRSIREAVVNKLRGVGMKFEDKSDDYVSSAFDLAIEDAASSKKNGDKQLAGSRADGKPPEKKAAAPVSAREARSKMIAAYSAA